MPLDYAAASTVSASSRSISDRLRMVMFAAVAVLLLLVLAFGWPTPFRYEQGSYDGKPCLVRINRFTQTPDFLVGGHWQRFWFDGGVERHAFTAQEIYDESLKGKK